MHILYIIFYSFISRRVKLKTLFNVSCVIMVMVASFLYSKRSEALDLYSSFGTEADTLGDGVSEFVDQLEGISRFRVNVKSPDDIGVGQSALLENVANGTIDMAIVLIAVQDRNDDSLNLEIDLYGESFPFGLQMEEYLSWHYNGGGLTILEDILKDDGDGIKVFPVIAATDQAAGMFKGEVTRERLESETTPVKMRSFGLGQDVLRKAYPFMQFIDAVPGSSATSDILDGLADDLDAAEFTSPQIDNKAFFVDANPNAQELGVTHYYLSAWQSPVTLHYLILNKKFYNKLNDKQKNIIKAAALASTQESYARLLKRQGEAIKEIEDAGVKIDEFSEEILTDLLVATESVLEEKAATNPRFDEVLSSMKKYVRNQQAWLDDGHIDRDFRFKSWGADWESDVKVGN